MLSTSADVLSIAQAAPWAAVAVLALIAAAWVYRQSLRAVKTARDEAAASARSQGKRIGEAEKAVALLDLRRRQVEQALLDEGVELPYWPPDGPQQPRPVAPRGSARRVDDDELSAETMQRRIPVPPLDLPRR